MAPPDHSKHASSKARPSLLGLYVELGRYGNPFPISMIYFPHLVGAIFAAGVAPRSEETAGLLRTSLIFVPAAALLHGAGCSWNDLVDDPLDRLVERTRNRPLPRGAISRPHAAWFTAAQTLAWLGILGLVSPRVTTWALPLIPAVAFYPYAKRLLPFPSVVLGLILAYGVVLGYASQHRVPLPPAAGEPPGVLTPLLCIVAAYTLFVTSIDMIYAHMDLKDDLRADIKSMAVTFRHYPKRALLTMALMQCGCLLTAGWLLQLGAPYVVLACGGGLMVNGLTIARVDLTSSPSCFWWFQAGTLMMGISLSAGFASELLATRMASNS